MIDRSEILRPRWQLALFAVLLLGWFVLGSVIEMLYAQLDGLAAQKLTFEQAKSIIATRPLWAGPVLFLIIAAMVADQLYRKKASLSAVFGEQGLHESLPESKGSGWGWLAAALAVLFTGFRIAEGIHAYYFLQDDNYAQFFPGILHGCRMFWSGHSAAWNPYQLLGAPLADLGIYALTYPLTHVSYLVAKYWAHDEMRMLDIFCWFHLTIACTLTYILGRKMRLSGPIAAAVAVCFALSGFALIAARSWYYMTPAMAAMPAIALLAMAFPQGNPSWKWTCGSGVILGTLFHAGNAQMWIYVVAFFTGLLALRIWKEEAPLRRLMGAVPALLIAAGIALPLLIPQMRVTDGVTRIPVGEGIAPGMISMLYPFPLVNAPLPDGMGMDRDNPTGQYYYAGTLFTLAWMIGLGALVVCRGARHQLKQNPFLCVSLIAFLLALGHQGILWTFHTRLPFLIQFTCPSKFLPFVHLFSLLVGAMLVERFLSSSARRATLQAASFVVLSALMLYHAGLCREAFYVWADSPNYDLPAELATLLTKNGTVHRVYPAAPPRAPGSHFVQSLQHNFPTLLQVSSFEGYDPLIRDNAPFLAIGAALFSNPMEILRRYGVEYVVVHRSTRAPVLSPNQGVHMLEDLRFVPHISSIEKAFTNQAPIFQNPQIAVYEVTQTEPIARFEHSTTAMETKIEGADIVVNTGQQTGEMLLNYIHRPGITASANGRQLEVRAGPFGKIAISVPKETRSVRVGYNIGWMTGSAIGLFVIFAGMLLQISNFLALTSRSQASESTAAMQFPDRGQAYRHGIGDRLLK